MFEFRSCSELQTASQEKHVIQKLETMNDMRMHADGFASLYKNTLKHTKGENTIKSFYIYFSRFLLWIITIVVSK